MRVVRLPMVAVSARQCDVIVVGSSVGRAFALDHRWKPASRVSVIPCGIDPMYFAPNDTNRSGGLLYAGSWFKSKGVEILAKAYELVRKEGCDIPLTVVGFGRPVDEVLRTFGALVRSDIVITERLRFLDEQTLVSEYRRHQVLAFPSFYEGFGMVLLEAMANALVVVATPVGGAVDLIQDNINGILVPQTDPEALAHAITDLWRSPEKRRRLGDAAQQTARLHTWDVIAERTLQCYRSCADGVLQSALRKS